MWGHSPDTQISNLRRILRKFKIEAEKTKVNKKPYILKKYSQVWLFNYLHLFFLTPRYPDIQLIAPMLERYHASIIIQHQISGVINSIKLRQTSTDESSSGNFKTGLDWKHFSSVRLQSITQGNRSEQSLRFILLFFGQTHSVKLHFLQGKLFKLILFFKSFTTTMVCFTKRYWFYAPIKMLCLFK